jgi:outer membrane protein TolC
LKPIPFLLLFAAATAAHADQPLSLSQALKTAQNRPNLVAARLKVASAQQTGKALGTLPPLSVGAGLSSHPDLGATDEDLYLRQPLDLFGRSSSGRALGRIRQSKAEVEVKTLQLQVQTEVLTRFFEAASAEESAKVAGDVSVLAEKVLAATTRRFEEGRVPEIQVLRAKMDLDRARQQEKLLLAQKASAFKLLAAAIGIDQTPTSLEAAELNATADVDLEARPDLKLAQLDADEVRAEAKSAKSALMPDLDLYGLKSGWSSTDTRFGARLQLSWNLWDSGRSRSEAKAFSLKAAALKAEREDLLIRARAEVESLNLEIKAAEEQLAAYRLLIDQAKVLVEKSQKGFNEGVGTLLEVLESTRSLREVEQESIAVRLRLKLLKAASLQATGTLLETKQ